MPPKLRAVHEAQMRMARELHEDGLELRRARLVAGLTQKRVAASLGWSASKVGRIERGQDAGVAIVDFARIAAVVGRQCWLRLYPGAPALRDAPQLQIAKRFLSLVGTSWKVFVEAGTEIVDDPRAFDVLLRGPVSIGVEFITRLREVQLQVRPIMNKQRDSGVDRIILVLSDTAANRQAVADAGPALDAAFPMRGRRVFAALRSGEDPGGNALLFT